MKEVSKLLKERFCKDCNIPLKLYEEPYFMERLELYDDLFGTLAKWKVFIAELLKYNCEQDYLEEYNQVKDKAINCIKQTEAYQKFNEEDGNAFVIQNINFPSKDIFKTSNDKKCFLNIDMKKANFTALFHYNPEIFQGACSWEEFIGIFTQNIHIRKSKYIRQVILGNCNPKRHIHYEKYLMDKILSKILGFIQRENIVFFSNDEIVIDMEDFQKEDRKKFLIQIQELLKEEIPLKIELFYLYKLYGTDGYIKKIENSDMSFKIELKCLENYILPFIMRTLRGENITEHDKIFFYEGLLSKFIELPKIELPQEIEDSVSKK